LNSAAVDDSTHKFKFERPQPYSSGAYLDSLVIVPGNFLPSSNVASMPVLFDDLPTDLILEVVNFLELPDPLSLLLVRFKSVAEQLPI
jgi:hypothetical protein